MCKNSSIIIIKYNNDNYLYCAEISVFVSIYPPPPKKKNVNAP